MADYWNEVGPVPSHFTLVLPSSIKGSETRLPILLAADGYKFSLGRPDSDLGYKGKGFVPRWPWDFHQ